MLFVSSQKLFSFSRYFNFCLDFLGMQKKRFDQTDKVNFEIYDVTPWLTKNYKTHIAQYLTNQRQPDNEILSVNRTSQEIYFSLKIMQKTMQANQFQTAFFFLKKSFLLDKSKWSAACFHYISVALKLAYDRNKLFKTLQY